MALLQSIAVSFWGRSRATWSWSGDSGQGPPGKKHIFLAEIWLMSSSQSSLADRNGCEELGPQLSPCCSSSPLHRRRHQYFPGEAMGLADLASLQIKYEAGRGKWELRLKLSGSYPWHERAGKGWGFPLSALVTNKEKKPKPVLKQLDSVTVAHLVLDLFVASFCFPCKVCAWNFCFIYLLEVFSLWESLHTPHRPNISSFFVRAEHLTKKHSVWRKESCICQFIKLTHSIFSVSNPPALRLILSVHQQNMILNPA